MENIAFPFGINNGHVETAGYAESVRQSVQVILLTGKGERLFLENFGTNLKRYMFEPLNETTYEIIRTEIRNALYEWEDRIKDIDVALKADEKEGRLNISVSYNIISINTTDSVTVTVYSA